MHLIHSHLCIILQAWGSTQLHVTAAITACLHRVLAVQGWGLHIWGDVDHPTPWSSAKQPSGSGPEGPYWDVELQTSAKHVGLLIHKGEEKAAGTARLI
jgi:hypothetical protein